MASGTVDPPQSSNNYNHYDQSSQCPTVVQPDQTLEWIGDNYYYDEDTLRTNSVVVVGSSDRSPFHSIHAIMSLRVHLPARVHASSSGVSAAAQELMDLES